MAVAKILHCVQDDWHHKGFRVFEEAISQRGVKTMATVTKRGKSFQIRVSCGFDGNGERVVKCMTWKPERGMTEKQAAKEAEHQAVLFEERCRTGLTLNNSMRLRDFVDIWIKYHADKQLRSTTLLRYKGVMLRRILAAFGNMKISAIQPQHLNAFYDNLEEAGVRADIKYAPCADFKALMKERAITQAALAEKAGTSVFVVKSCVDGKNVSAESAQKVSKALSVRIDELFTPNADEGLSKKTILHHHRLISTILQSAVVTYQLIPSNPCARIVPPKADAKEARYLDEDEVADLLEALEGEAYQFCVIVHTLLDTGMRRGELCGLEWKDVDFAGKQLHIRRSSLYVPDKGVFEDETKNKTSWKRS